MANGNPFYVHPGGDYSQGLSGLSNLVQSYGQRQDEEEQRERAELRFNEVKAAGEAAIDSGDPNEMRKAVIEYPELKEALTMEFGFTNDISEDIAVDTYTRTLADPANAEEYLGLGIEAVRDAGGNPDIMLQDVLSLRRNPERRDQILNKMELTYAGMASKEQYAAYQNMKEAPYRQQEMSIKQETLDIRRSESELRRDEQALARETNELKRDQLRTKIDQDKLKLTESKKKVKQDTQKADDTLTMGINTVDKLLEHPGLESAVGFSSVTPTIPGTNAADFEAELENFDAQLYLTSVAQMKGMGALSDAEGKKISAAAGAIKLGMSEDAFKRNLETIKDNMELAKSRMDTGERVNPDGSKAQNTEPVSKVKEPLSIDDLVNKYAQ